MSEEQKFQVEKKRKKPKTTSQAHHMNQPQENTDSPLTFSKSDTVNQPVSEKEISPAETSPPAKSFHADRTVNLKQQTSRSTIPEQQEQSARHLQQRRHNLATARENLTDVDSNHQALSFSSSELHESSIDQETIQSFTATKEKEIEQQPSQSKKESGSFRNREKPTSSTTTKRHRTNQRNSKYSRKFIDDITDSSSTDHLEKQEQKTSSFQFKEKESTPKLESSHPKTKITKEKVIDPKLEKYQSKAKKVEEKLERAKKKLPVHHHIQANKAYDPEAGKVKRKLHFEKEVKSQAEHIKGAVPLRPVKKGANAASGYAHTKIHQVEHENVGVEAGHKVELLGESGARKFYHARKTAPYRRVAKLERKTKKKTIQYMYHQALHDNPKLKSNLAARFLHKQKIKRQYAQAARAAKKGAKSAKNAGSAVVKTAQAIGRLVSSHPVVFGIIALLLFLIFFVMTMVGSCSHIASGSMSTVLASSYLAEDTDIDDAEIAYTEWETDLLLEVQNAEITHPGYDEYRYNVADVSHNPYELLAFLTAKYQDFVYSDIASDLRSIFDEQYQLSFVPETETRYRTETRTDSDGNSYTVQVAYDWHILNVNLTARSFTDVIASKMDTDQQEIFSLLLYSKGNRQYTFNPFSFNWLPYVSGRYGWQLQGGAKVFNSGIDISVPAGSEILATHDGKVTFTGSDGGNGLTVVLENPSMGSTKDTLTTRYAQCGSLLVSVGQEVKKGDPIATSSSSAPMHFELLLNGRHLNPLFFADTGDDGSGETPPGLPGGGGFPAYPGAPLGSGSYAALIAEGEKHLGKKYVFGANGPANFDCSSFVCWVLDKSGVYPMGRTTAQGLYNISTPVSRADAKPGDLIFFTKTYSTSDTITHVGFYVGNNQMLHCGNPIQYTSISTNYWQSHFYSFGRISN